jgi:hypothetical protein
MNNLQCFPEYIQIQVQSVDPNEVWNRVQIEDFKDGGPPVCNYYNGECWVQICSENPVNQAQNWADSLRLEEIGAMFVYGCGFGYALAEVLHRVHPDSIVVFFEREIHIFIAMLHMFDLRPLFQKHNKCIFFIGDAKDVAQHFSVLLITHHMYFLTKPAVVYSPGAKLFKKDYSEIHQFVFELLAQQVFARGNDHYDSMLGFRNMVENAPVVVDNPHLRTLWQQFQGVPVFIVANGPSLDRNIQELKRVGHKGLILCCESAIAALMKNGIQPDAIVVAERTPASYQYHFQNIEYSENIILLALSVADPRIFRSFPGQRIPIFRSMESNSQWLNRILADGEGVSGGINVSHLAFELAVYVGANPVVFVGQDLAYGTDGTTHSKHSKYTNEGHYYIDEIKKSPVVYVEGNDDGSGGGPIPSTSAWVDYRKWLEQLIEQNPSRTVINSTEGGAKIQGTQNRKLADVIDQYCTVDLPDTFCDLIREAKAKIDLVQKQAALLNLVVELKKYVEIYRALEKVASKSGEVTARLWAKDELLTSMKHRPAFEKIYEQNNQVIDNFLLPDVHHVFLQLPIIYGHYQINRIGAINSFSKLQDAVKIQVRLFDHLASVCESLARNFQIAAERLLSDTPALNNPARRTGGTET